jgi:uncharacterized membrane protein
MALRNRKSSQDSSIRASAESQEPAGLGRVLERNIEVLYRRREQEAANAPLEQRIADAITRFTGSMSFVYLHILIFGFWIIANLRLIPGIPAWDESFVILAMAASVEAIFLSTFVLISQNRMAAVADRRADLDLQITLLTEHEITKLTTVVSEIATKMGIKTGVDHELAEIKRDVSPEDVLEEIEKKTGQ